MILISYHKIYFILLFRFLSNDRQIEAHERNHLEFSLQGQGHYHRFIRHSCRYNLILTGKTAIKRFHLNSFANLIGQQI